MNIELAVRLVRALDPDATALEVAEALWFASVAQPQGSTSMLGPGPAASDNQADDTQADAEETLATEQHSRSMPSTVDDHDHAALSPPALDAGGAVQASGQPIRVPEASALPSRKAIQRALRPLKRRVPADNDLVLDEEESVQLIAETGAWVPVMKPAPMKWLDLVLVVDTSPSLGLWDTLVSDFETTLRQLGAFRDIRRWQLYSGADGDAAAIAPHSVFVEGSGTRGLRRPGELVDAAHRRAFFVVTDGVADMWRDGTGAALLATLAGAGPTAVLQPLPERLWNRTGLPSRRGSFRSTDVGAPTSRASFTERRRLPRKRNRGDIPVPVLEFSPEWLSAWSALITASSSGPIPLAATIVGPGTGPLSRPAPSLQPSRAEQADPRRALSRFRASASPTAYRLATYLAAAPLHLPVMRLIQQLMLPDSGPMHLSEVLLDGIVEGIDDELSFDYLPGIRSLLLDELRISEANDVIDAVSHYVVQRGGLPGRTFNAIASVENGTSVQNTDGQFAWIPKEMLLRMGVRPSPVTNPTAPGEVNSAEQSRAREVDRPEEPAHSASPRLPDLSGTRAVLVGTSRYANMENLPSVRANLERLAELFRDESVLGLPVENVVVVADPESTAAVLDEIRMAAAAASDTLLVYYAGHGILDGGDDLLLALPDTDPARPYTAIRFDDVRRQVQRTRPFADSVIILDCCYSGRAMAGAMGAYELDSDNLANRAAVEGSYLMVAAASPRIALAPPGETYTAFTGELIKILEEGIEGAPEWITVEQAFQHIRGELLAKARPVPAQRARNSGHRIVLSRNRWIGEPDARATAPATSVTAAQPARRIPGADGYPVTDSAELNPPLRRRFRRRRRELHEIPRQPPGSVLVFQVGDSYEVLPEGMLQLDEQIVVDAVAVAVVSLRQTLVEAVTHLLTADPRISVALRVSYLCQVNDPQLVLDAGCWDAYPILTDYLNRDSRLRFMAQDADLVRGWPHFQRNAMARLVAYHELNPLIVPGLTVRLSNIAVELQRFGTAPGARDTYEPRPATPLAPPADDGIRTGDGS